MLDRVVAALRSAGPMSAKARVLSAVNCSERAAPAVKRSARSGARARSAGMTAKAPIGRGEERSVDDQHPPEAEAAHQRRGHRLHREVAEEVDEDEGAGLDRGHPEADLQQERQQEGRGVDRDAPEGAGGEGREGEGTHGEHVEADERHPRPAQVADRQPAGAPCPLRAARRRGAACRATKASSPATTSTIAPETSRKPGQSNGRGSGARLARHQGEEQDRGGEAERDVDVEVPLPAEVRGDPAADERADDRRGQGRPGDGGDRRHHPGLRRALQHQVASDRHHQRRGRPLQRPGGHEAFEAGRQAAEDGGGGEADYGGDQDLARAEPVGEPAGQRDQAGHG